MITRLKFIAIALLLTGCESFDSPEDKYAGKWILRNYINDYSYTGMIVDSLQMKSTKEADVWIGGTKQKIFGNNLSPIYYPKK